MQPQWTIIQKRRCTQSETYPAQKLRSYLNTPFGQRIFLSAPLRVQYFNRLKWAYIIMSYLQHSTRAWLELLVPVLVYVGGL